MARSTAMALLAAALFASGCGDLEQEAIDISHNRLMGEAQRDVRAGRYDAAVRKLEQATSLKPQHEAARLSLGNALVLRAQQPDVGGKVRTGFLERALAAHTAALDLAPDRPQRNYLVARDLILLERPAEAMKYLQIAQAFDPEIPFIDARLGDACRLQKEYEKAIEHYRNGLARPAHRRATMELHEGLAETFAAQGKVAEALEEFALAGKSATSRRHRKRIEERIADLTKPAPEN